MSIPDPKKDQVNTSGAAQKSAYPLDNYTVAPQSSASGGGEESSPYFKSAAPSIALPKGGGALKGIDEKFTVNAVNGTAALQVPLPLSPGRGGFTPSLSLSYNSGGGNSEFGLGWSLGLPAIQRKTDKQLPKYNDSNESDIFMIAGAEDLVPELNSLGVPVVLTSSSYTIKRYRPRIEGLFASIERITKSGQLDSWWKVTSKENIVTYYGLTAEARISDPTNANRIFKWLPQISYDRKGNVQRYSYVTDSSASFVPAALHEQNRANGLAPFTNTYLKQVSYCNVSPFTATSDYEPSLLADPGYKMICVLDYGNYNTAFPSVTDNGTVPKRVDAFSDFHAGFEIRTYRRCQRVLMFHSFSELFTGVTSPPPACLVRSLTFTYSQGTGTALAEADYITSIVQSGYKLQSGTSYIKKDLPAMTLNYTPLTWDNTVRNVDGTDTEHAPQGITGPYQWIDLWGEGLPGILTEQAQGWFYKANLGNGHFSHALPVAEKPSYSGLGGGMQWSDLDADGRRHLVSRNPASPGYFELDDDQQWQPFVPFEEMTNVDWESPFTRMIDLNGDGRPDLLLTEENVWKWYENDGKKGYTEGGYANAVLDEEKGPRMLHNDNLQVIFLADMNGDGMTDIVRIQNGEVCYWPNMGYGKFGAKVTMSNAPLFDLPDVFDPKYLTLADISGTGAPDLIYVGKVKCTAWINLAGNGWSSPVDICTLPGMEQFSKMTIADFTGNGTACVVWSSPLPQHDWSPMRYIDLMGGKKPYLMSSYSNGMGKTTELTYKQSTKYYLEDKAAGKPWVTNLPFPVQCVQQIKTIDTVSNTSYVQQYNYHHGYYDHEEREFRGFGKVETIDTDIAYALNTALTSGTTSASDLNQYPVKTITWNHTGAWMQAGKLVAALGSYDGYMPAWANLPAAPDLPAGLSVQETREAYRALKGQPLRQEVYALDGDTNQYLPYSVTMHAYAIKLVQPQAGNRFASFISYQQQSLAFSCERNIADPRVMHELTLETDQYGNVLKSAKVCYPRSLAYTTGIAVVDGVQQKMLCTYTENKFTNDVITDTTRHLRVPYEAKTYEVTGLTITPGTLWTCTTLNAKINGVAAAGGGWTIAPATEISYTTNPTTTGTIPVEKKAINVTRTLYAADATPATALSLGTIESLAIPYQQYHLAITDDMLSHANWYNGLITATSMLTTEGGYLREADISQFSSTSTTRYWLPSGTATYDTAHFYTPTAYTDPWGQTTTVTYWNTGGTNYYLLPQTVTDALGNATTVTAYNWYNLQPTSITDANNNISEILFDALGMPIAMAVKGKGTEGDALGTLDPHSTADGTAQTAFWTNPAANAATLLGSATWRCVYNLSASPVSVAMIGRETHYNATGGTTSPLLLRFTYTDGLGRIAMNKVQAAPDESTPTIARWAGNGKVVYNNKGKAVMQYEPYFSTTHAYDAAEAAATVGVTPRLRYDALGRVMRTDLPDGSYTKTEWTAWTQKSYDNNDTLATTGNAWYTAASTSSDANLVDAATKALRHANTYTQVHMDTLARPFYTVVKDAHPDSGGVWQTYDYASYVVLDLTGDRMSVNTYRGTTLLTPLTYSYNLLKAPVKQVSIDSGTQCMLTDAANQPLYMWDAAGNRFRHTYDALRRQLTQEVLTSAAVTKRLQAVTYGDTVSSAATYNLKGKLYESYDGLGYKKISSYDFKGAPLQVSEQLLTDRTITDVDWASSPTLNTEVFSTTTTYDALGRLKTATDPGGNINRHVYDSGGMLTQVYLTPAGGSETAYVSSIYYDAKGQRKKITYGNGTSTTYTYDAKTFRLTRLLTTKTTNTYQDLNYWYDPVGNITKVKDSAQRSLYFSNSVTNPVMDYTYDGLYRLIAATGREQISAATYGDSAGHFANDNTDDSGWMGGNIGANDATVCQNYTQKYTYDEAGNIQTLQHIAGSGSYTRTYNYTTGTNRLANTVVGSRTYSYTHDARGNITAMPHLSNITFNTRNEMSTANLGGGGNAYYQYSGGERGRKTIVNGTITEERIYFGTYEIYRKFNGSSLTLERTTMHVNDDTGRIAMLEKRTSGTDGSLATLVRYIYSNHLSTASLELDDTAAIISYEEYHPYGTTSYQAKSATINAVAKRYRFTGKERDEETGLYYMSARYYVPWLGRWCAVDPLESMYAGWSSYNYCTCNPVNHTDSTGMGNDDDAQKKYEEGEKKTQAMFQSKLDEVANSKADAGFKEWFANLGPEGLTAFRDALFQSKVDHWQNNQFQRDWIGRDPNDPSKAYLPEEIRKQYWNEAIAETVPGLKTLWATQQSGRSSGISFMRNRALTVSNRDEGWDLLSEVSKQVILEWAIHLSMGGAQNLKGTFNLAKSEINSIYRFNGYKISTKTAPIDIPSNATITPAVKQAGYTQVSYKWTENGLKYEARWHTPTPKAPQGQVNNWVVTRVRPGTPTGQVKQAEVLIGKNRWVGWKTWESAVKAYQNGIATTFQKSLLKWGHWAAE
jgi:RHS repeat-associated protein